jgi:hypothetical protein
VAFGKGIKKDDSCFEAELFRIMFFRLGFALKEHQDLERLPN